MSEMDNKGFILLKNRKMFIHYIIILIIVSLISVVAAPTLWTENLYLFHTILELMCIFISIAIFLIVWNTYEKTLNLNHVIGLGYMAVAIFGSFHTYYFFAARVLNQGYADISTRYWIVGRLIEALVLFIVSTKLRKLLINKWFGLSSTIFISLVISVAILFFPQVLPVMKTTDGLTPAKIIFEYVVIIITIISLYNLRNNINDSDIVSYKHIFMVLLLIIPTELAFTLFDTETSFFHTYGHLLKIVYSYYLYRAIFVSTITYPYRRLEIERLELENKHAEITQLGETLNGLLDALPIGVVMYDTNARLKYANRRFEELLECDKSKLTGLSSRELRRMFVAIKDDEMTLCEKALQNSKGVHRSIETFRTLKSNYIKLSFSSQRMKNGVIVLFSDVKKEQELQNLQLQTQTVLNAIEKLVVIVDKDNKILMCNKTHEDVTGVSAKDIIGMDLYEHLSTLQVYIENKYEQDDIIIKHRTFEASLTTIYGQVRRILFSTSPIYNIDGEVIGSIGVASDITELREQQEKMIRQEKLALLGQMGAGIVHETRNYLTTIKGSCQIIDMLTQEESIRGYTSRINKSINEVNRIISEFLTLSRHRETELLEVSIYDIIKSIKGLVETSSLTSGVKIEFLLSDEERYLLCDEAQISQVVLNICKNAVEAMFGVEDARLRVEAGYDEEKYEMFIKISDNGHGMSKDTLKKIGTPFFTTKRSGTGIGLSVCYKIIEEHHGKILVESEQGRGTTFVITLPCIKDDEFDEAM